MQFASMHAERMPPSRTDEGDVSFRGRKRVGAAQVSIYVVMVALLGGGVTAPSRGAARPATATQVHRQRNWMTPVTGFGAVRPDRLRVYVCVSA